MDRIDKAAAHIRLRNFEKADGILLQLLEEKPDDYYVLSNLGVSKKKQGDYEAAVEWLEKALKIKPEGHMGLGDWYLKSIRYSQGVKKKPTHEPKKNFLGQDYANSLDPYTNPGRNRDQSEEDKKQLKLLEKLLKNDQSFADGFLVMGDALAKNGDLNIAKLSYRRALSLGHPNKVEITRRIKEIDTHYKSGSSSAKKTSRTGVRIPSAHELSKAVDWKKKFQFTESEIIREKETLPDFREVEKLMEQRGVFRYRP